MNIPIVEYHQSIEEFIEEIQNDLEKIKGAKYCTETVSELKCIQKKVNDYNEANNTSIEVKGLDAEIIGMLSQL